MRGGDEATAVDDRSRRDPRAIVQRDAICGQRGDGAPGQDRFGGQVEPREWFLVPLPAIDEAIKRIKDGTIGGFRYDPETACLVPA